ncbi:MAG: L,D-transpeptidase [Rhodospirillales bacterium]|nr:L,D-transpeptidase [Alphaproteobacteria bacterium]MCB9986731.1 L,D-transpeptidase [Rhodospirillales bacterium]USO08500.1 MAG: L,D-transpeptidase [Rhodospirillales bacterium]
MRTKFASRLFRAAAAAALFGALTGAVQAGDLNEGFAGLNTASHDLNGAAVTGGSYGGRSSAVYNRAAHPGLWDHRGIARPHVVGYRGNQPAGSLLLDHKYQHLYLILEGGRAIEYVVAVGRKGMEIGGGSHQIARKEIDPTWGDRGAMAVPGPQNPLGVRGMFLADTRGVEHGFTIHGTNDPAKLRQPDGARTPSHGCIRMANDDVIDLYNRVHVGARVTVRFDDSVRNEIKEGGHVARLAAQP